MKANLNTYRQSPRKVRIIADLIRGKNVAQAKNVLMFADRRAAPVISKLLDSAIANAKTNFGVETDGLFVKEIRVDKGITMKRMMPRARGSGFPINKRTSHIAIVLGMKEGSEPKAEKVAKAPKAKAEKVAKAEKPKRATKTTKKSEK